MFEANEAYFDLRSDWTALEDISEREGWSNDDSFSRWNFTRNTACCSFFLAAPACIRARLSGDGDIRPLPRPRRRVGILSFSMVVPPPRAPGVPGVPGPTPGPTPGPGAQAETATQRSFGVGEDGTELT